MPSPALPKMYTPRWNVGGLGSAEMFTPDRTRSKPKTAFHGLWSYFEVGETFRSQAFVKVSQRAEGIRGCGAKAASCPLVEICRTLVLSFMEGLNRE